MSPLRGTKQHLANFFSRKPRLRASYSERFRARFQQSLFYFRIARQVLGIREIGRISSTVIVGRSDTIDAALENRLGEEIRKGTDALPRESGVFAALKGALHGSVHPIIRKRGLSNPSPFRRHRGKIERGVVVDSRKVIGS